MAVNWDPFCHIASALSCYPWSSGKNRPLLMQVVSRVVLIVVVSNIVFETAQYWSSIRVWPYLILIDYFVFFMAIEEKYNCVFQSCFDLFASYYILAIIKLWCLCSILSFYICKLVFSPFDRKLWYIFHCILKFIDL